MDQPQIIGRQRKIADILTEQAFQSQPGQMVSGHYVAPGWGAQIAKVLSAYAGAKMHEEADKKQAEYDSGMKQKLVEGLRNYKNNLMGMPAQSIAPAAPNDDGNANPSVNIPAKAPDQGEAIESLINSGHPMLQQFGMQQAQKLPEILKDQKRQEYLGTLNNSNFDPRQALSAGMPPKDITELNKVFNPQPKLPWYVKQNGDETTIDPAYLNMMAAKQQQNPYYQFLPTANGYAVGNARTGQISPINIGGAPIIRPQDSPEVQAAIAKAKEQEKAKAALFEKSEVAKNEQTRGAFNALAAAGYDPNTGADRVSELIKQSTSGGAQKLGADAAGFFNVSTPGKEAITQLAAISKQITIDRLNGKLGAGISNSDVAILDQTLGDMANPSIPAPARLKAWEQAKRILVDASKKNQNSPKQSTSNKTVVRTGTANGRKVVQYSDGSIDYAD